MTSYATVQIAVGPLASWTTDYVLLDSSAWTTMAGSPMLMSTGSMAMGKISAAANATATVITTADTWTRVGIGSTFTGTNHWTNHVSGSPTAGRLVYIGPHAHLMHAGCTVTLKPAGANDTFSCMLYLSGGVNGNNEYTSGTALTRGTVTQKGGGAGDLLSTAIHVFASMTSGNYLELAVKNTGDTDDVTIQDVNLFAVGVL